MHALVDRMPSLEIPVSSTEIRRKSEPSVTTPPRTVTHLVLETNPSRRRREGIPPLWRIEGGRIAPTAAFDQSRNGSWTRMVSSRSGEVDSIATGAPISSST